MGVVTSNLLNARRQVILGSQPQIHTATGHIAKFTTDVPADIKTGMLTISPLYFKAGAPTPSNKCTIDGITSLNIHHVGTNLYQPKAPSDSFSITGVMYTYKDDGSIEIIGDNSGSQIDNLHSLDYIPSGKYLATVGILSARDSRSVELAESQFAPYIYDSTTASRVKEWDGTTNMCFGGGMWEEITLIGDHTNSFRFRVYNTKKKKKKVIVQPFIITPNQLYSTITINLPSEAGTVYGGTIDFETGTLTVTYGSFTIDGSGSITSVTDRGNGELTGWAAATGLQIYNGTPICDQMEFTKTTSMPSALYTFSQNSTYKSSLYYRLPYGGTGQPTAATVAAVKTWFSSNPMKIVAPLLTPKTYTISPIVLHAHRGPNHFFTDAGDITVNYWGH